MSDLVVEAADRPGLDQCWASLKVVGPAVSSAQAAADGDWASLQGLGGAFGAAMDVAEFAIDPIASMAASVAGFLLDYMPPLPDMLDSLAGDPRAVAAEAATWGNVANRVREVTTDLEAAVARALAGWQGPAAYAYDQFSAAFRTMLDTVGSICDGVGAAMTGASVVVGFVRGLVRDIIADLVGKLISWASQVAATVGVGATWVVPQAVTAIAIRVERVRDWLTRLTGAVQSLAEILNDVNRALTDGVPALRRLSTVLDRPLAPSFPGITAPSLNSVVDTATNLSGLVNRATAAQGQVDAAGGTR